MVRKPVELDRSESKRGRRPGCSILRQGRESSCRLGWGFRCPGGARQPLKGCHCEWQENMLTENCPGEQPRVLRGLAFPVQPETHDQH